MVTMQRNVNNSVFVNIFKEKKYLLELYQALHPENSICEDDLEVITIENILANDQAHRSCRSTDYMEQKHHNAYVSLSGENVSGSYLRQ